MSNFAIDIYRNSARNIEFEERVNEIYGKYNFYHQEIPRLIESLYDSTFPIAPSETTHHHQNTRIENEQ